MELSKREMAKMIDLSCVRADHTETEIADMADAAKKYNCICAFTLPAHTSYLVNQLSGRRDIHIDGVVGFPDGGTTTTNKINIATELISFGADELDMVINISWLKSGRNEAVYEDIKAVVDTADGLPVKVILECSYLTNEEIERGCQLGIDAGALFIKTATGWSPEATTLENIRLITDTVGGRCKVKAAGGIRTKEQIQSMYDLGVTRFGIGVRTALFILEAEI